MSEPAHSGPYRVEPPSGGYKVEKREVVAQTPELRMVILTLAPGQEVPWHFHSRVTDTFFCLEGPMAIEVGEPGGPGRAVQTVALAAGQTHAVPSPRPHRVTGQGGGRCRFAILQGVGAYDFKPVR